MGNSGQQQFPSCSESAATDTSAGKGRYMWRWGSFPSGAGVGGGRFAARTVAVWSYPRVRSSPHLPYIMDYIIHIDVSPPQEILVVTDGGSFLCGSNEIGRTYIAVHPLSVNTISRLMYWYNSTLNAVMVQSLDGNAVSVSS